MTTEPGTAQNADSTQESGRDSERVCSPFVGGSYADSAWRIGYFDGIEGESAAYSGGPPYRQGYHAGRKARAALGAQP